MCGLPPYGPDSLIDIQVVRDRVRLSNKVLAPPALQLTDEEAAGLRVVLRLAEAQGWPETRALASAVKKLEEALLPERREGARRLARRVAVAGASEGGKDDRNLPLVRRAIEKRTSLDVDYYSDGREELTTRRMDPYRVVALARGRYVIAFCHLRKAIQTFRLDRFVRARRTQPALRGAGRPARHRLRGRRAARRRAHGGGDDPLRPRGRAPRARDLPRGRRRRTADGGALLTARVWANRAFCREIARWGGAAEVIAPDSVRAMVRDDAKERLRRYEA